MNEIKALVKNIDPWDSVIDKEGICLYNLARQVLGGYCIVEIGSWKGRSTTWLARGSQDGDRVPVFAIDPHENTTTHAQYDSKGTYEEFIANIKRAGVENIVHPIRDRAETVLPSWDKRIGLLFIDGSHDYNSVKQDFLWTRHLAPGGIVALHDTTGYDGPRRVTVEEIFKSGWFKNPWVCGKITYTVKRSRQGLPSSTALFTLWNIYRMMYQVRGPVAKAKRRLG